MRSIVASGLSLALAILAGCGGGGGGGAPGTGTLEVRVTDAPFPVSCFAEATILVDRIEIQAQGNAGDVSGWVTVTSTAQVWNLLDLAGGVSQTAAFTQLPAGTYHMVRLIMSPTASAILTWTDGFQRTFKVPSDTVKIVPTPNIVIVPGQTTRLLLDFDLAHSFVQQGPPAASCDDLKQANRITFTPVVRATNQDANGLLDGIVADQASGSGLPGATVTASGSGGSASTITSAGTNGEPAGFYALVLDPGAYTVTFEAPGHVSETANVTVETGKETRQDAALP